MSRPVLQPLPPNLGPLLKGADGGAAAVVNFVNQLDREVEISWIGNDGARNSLGKVQPGEIKRVTTYDRHPWEVVGRDFKELYLPNAGAESDAILKWFTSGKLYQIINIKTGTVVDLNGNDRSSITGYQNYSTDNQKWFIESAGGKWTIRNKWLPSSYLGLGQTGVVKESTLRAISTAFPWEIRRESDGVYRILPPSSQFSVDLAGGSANPATPIQLWDTQAGNTNQLWRLIEVLS